MDAVLLLHTSVEMIDMQSQGGIAQADLDKYDDKICALRTANWIEAESNNPALAAAFLRIHSLPSIVLRVASASAICMYWTCGVTTGSRSAAVAVRIPLIAIARKRAPEWAGRGFCTSTFRSALGAYVDNICSIAYSASSAIWILEDLEHCLKRS